MEVADEQNLSCKRRASREPFDVLSISQFSLLSRSLSSLSLSLLSLVHTHFPNPPPHTHFIIPTHTHMLISSWTFSPKNKHFQAGTCKNSLHMNYILPVSPVYLSPCLTLSCRSAGVDMQEVNRMPELQNIIIHLTPAPNHTYHPCEWGCRQLKWFLEIYSSFFWMDGWMTYISFSLFLSDEIIHPCAIITVETWIAVWNLFFVPTNKRHCPPQSQLSWQKDLVKAKRQPYQICC